jgi:thiamine biosynthesis lipoprotein
MTLAALVLAACAVPAADPPASDPAPKLKRFERVEPHMGTRFQITLYAPDESVAHGALKAAFARIAELDGIMTDYRPTSELIQLCRKAGGEPVPVSRDLFEVLARAQEVAQRSDGAFDITVGPVVRLWRRARRTHELPDPARLKEALALVGYAKVRLDPQQRTVQLLRPGMRLDLGGIGKGFAADKALAVLKQHGIDRALVAAGGDIAVSGPPPGTEGWVVGLAPLENPASKPARALVLHHAAVSTSGDAEQYVEIGGRRYSHIVDPRTGLGLVGRMSVTVVAPNGTTADSLTKVVAVLGPARGFPIIDETPGAASLHIRLSDHGHEVHQSKRFAHLKQKVPGGSTP